MPCKLEPWSFDPKCTLLTPCCEIQDFPSLLLKVQKYTHTDGRTVPLLMAEGTLPMYYQVCLELRHSCARFATNLFRKLLAPVQGAKYNIPVSLWLPETYPNVPPIMYVVPTPDMIIKPRHAFVDASGIVNTPYLRNWQQPHSTLMIMCNDISIQFGQDPPLFSKPPGWVAPQHQQPSHQQTSPAQASTHRPSPSPSHHTFQAENPMNRYVAAVKLQTYL